MTAEQTMPLVPRPAANERSPNRKLRTRRQRYDQLRAYELHHLKKLWLKLYRATGNQIACERIERLPNTVERWLTDDRAFREERDKIRDTWDGLLNGRFAALGEEAVEVVKEILENPLTDDALKIKVAQWVLKSQGIGVEKSKTTMEHAGPNGGPIPTIVVRTAPRPE